MWERKVIRKRKERGISASIIVMILVIAFVVAGVSGYLAILGSGTSPSTSATSTTKLASSQSGDIAAATSYEFNETTTASNGTVLDTTYYAAKNLGMSNTDIIWVETTPSNGTRECILNEAQQRVWSCEGGRWTDISVISSQYTTILVSIESAGVSYVNMLEDLCGSGSFIYTIPSGQPNEGATATFTNIHINPSLPDSLFQPHG